MSSSNPADDEVVTSLPAHAGRGRPGVLADISRILATLDSINAWCNASPPRAKSCRHHHAHHQTRERTSTPLGKIEKLPVVTAKVRRIRLEELQ